MLCGAPRGPGSRWGRASSFGPWSAGWERDYGFSNAAVPSERGNRSKSARVKAARSREQASDGPENASVPISQLASRAEQQGSTWAE
jgi:hypothetical protein